MKRAILIFLLFLLFLPFIGCNKKDDFQSRNKFELLENGLSYRFAGYNSNGMVNYDIIIPEEYEGLPVTVIGENALSSSKVNTIFVSKTITALEGNQSISNSVTSIIVDEDNQVFDSRNNCNAIIETETDKLIIGCCKTVIPNTVKEIGKYAFYGLSFGSTIKIPNSVEIIDDYAFSSTHMDVIALPESLKVLGDGAFGEARIRAIRLPRSLEVIGDYCFYRTQIINLKIYDNVSSIGKGITSMNNFLQKIEVIDNPFFDSRDNCNAIIETNTNTLIAGSSNTIIPNSVESIANDALYGIHYSKLLIPKSVKFIGYQALYAPWKDSILEFEITSSWKIYQKADKKTSVSFSDDHTYTYEQYYGYYWINEGDDGK